MRRASCPSRATYESHEIPHETHALLAIWIIRSVSTLYLPIRRFSMSVLKLNWRMTDDGRARGLTSNRCFLRERHEMIAHLALTNIAHLLSPACSCHATRSWKKGTSLPSCRRGRKPTQISHDKRRRQGEDCAYIAGGSTFFSEIVFLQSLVGVLFVQSSLKLAASSSNSWV